MGIIMKITIEDLCILYKATKDYDKSEEILRAIKKLGDKTNMMAKMIICKENK